MVGKYFLSPLWPEYLPTTEPAVTPTPDPTPALASTTPAEQHQH